MNYTRTDLDTKTILRVQGELDAISVLRQMDGLKLSTDKLDLAAPDRCDLTSSFFS